MFHSSLLPSLYHSFFRFFLHFFFHSFFHTFLPTSLPYSNSLLRVLITLLFFPHYLSPLSLYPPNLPPSFQSPAPMHHTLPSLLAFPSFFLVFPPTFPLCRPLPPSSLSPSFPASLPPPMSLSHPPFSPSLSLLLSRLPTHLTPMPFPPSLFPSFLLPSLPSPDVSVCIPHQHGTRTSLSSDQTSRG